jgi:single-strand DNA-binding protein
MSIIANIYGRAGQDGELRASKAGKPWCRVGVACEAGTDRESGEALTQWLTVVAFGRQAEELAKVEKGQSISAIGRIEVNRWTGQDGTEHKGLNLIADAVLTVKSARPGGRKKSNGDRPEYSGNKRAQSPGMDVPFDDDLPF